MNTTHSIETWADELNPLLSEEPSPPLALDIAETLDVRAYMLGPVAIYGKPVSASLHYMTLDQINSTDWTNKLLYIIQKDDDAKYLVRYATLISS
jgi:hypothetical protein